MSGATLMIHPVATGSFPVTQYPSSASGTVYDYGTATTTSTLGAAVLSGGVPPYNYSWTCTNSIVPVSPTSQSTLFSYSFTSTGTQSGVATVTVTDVNGNTGSATVATISLRCILSGGR